MMSDGYIVIYPCMTHAEYRPAISPVVAISGEWYPDAKASKARRHRDPTNTHRYEKNRAWRTSGALMNAHERAIDSSLPPDRSGYLFSRLQQALASLPVALQVTGVELGWIFGETRYRKVTGRCYHLNLAISRGIGDEIEGAVVVIRTHHHGVGQRGLGL